MKYSAESAYYFLLWCNLKLNVEYVNSYVGSGNKILTRILEFIQFFLVVKNKLQNIFLTNLGVKCPLFYRHTKYFSSIKS